MEVLYSEGVAIHGGPESCGGAREGVGEALTGGVWAGLLSREISVYRGADVLHNNGRPCRWRRYRESLVDPARSKNPGTHVDPHAREPGGPVVDHGPSMMPRPYGVRGVADRRPGGPRGERQGGNPSMNDRGKSDRPVVPAKPPNNPGRPGAEGVEERGLPEGIRPVKHAPDTAPDRA